MEDKANCREDRVRFGCFVGPKSLGAAGVINPNKQCLEDTWRLAQKDTICLCAFMGDFVSLWRKEKKTVLLRTDSSHLRERNSFWKGSFLFVQQKHKVLHLQAGTATVRRHRVGQR